MTEADRKAYVIADNRLADLAGWDQELLKLELGSIIELDAAFDLTLTGFADAELEGLLAALDAADRPATEEIPEPATDAVPVSAPGQLWILGRHRVRTSYLARRERSSTAR
jgi:hypothetical protein